MNKRYFCFLVLSASVLSGCGLTSTQVRAVRSFGSATKCVGQMGEEEFIRIRKEIIRMNKELYAIDNTKTSDSMVLDYPVSAEAASGRVAACKALRSYGELLVRLSGESRAEELASASEDLVNNACAALNKKMSEEESDAVGSLVSGLGDCWIQKKKADALRKIVPVFSEPVEALADLIGEDFSLDSTSLGFLKAYEITARRLKNGTVKLIDAGNGFNILERDKAVEAYSLAETALIRADEVSEKAVKALKKLKKANTELAKAMSKTSFSMEDIRDFAEQIEELVNLIEVLTY